jgi:hypothetical protein
MAYILCMRISTTAQKLLCSGLIFLSRVCLTSIYALLQIQMWQISISPCVVNENQMDGCPFLKSTGIYIKHEDVLITGRVFTPTNWYTQYFWSKHWTQARGLPHWVNSPITQISIITVLFAFIRPSAFIFIPYRLYLLSRRGYINFVFSQTDRQTDRPLSVYTLGWKREKNEYESGDIKTFQEIIFIPVQWEREW